ncbi:MAG: hypothetical protein II330_06920 [Clostridia bacterium]|nr:hypothetical protein [Clostridia bacterium]MBQ2256580.1 hypothetical protein [Clostridia bacterium]
MMKLSLDRFCLLILLLCVSMTCIVACERTLPDSGKISVETSDIVIASEQESLNDGMPEDPTMAPASSENLLTAHSWEEFHQRIHSAGLKTTNPKSYEIFDHSIELEGYTVSSITVREYLNDPNKEDWDLTIYWDLDGVAESSKTEVRMHIFMISEGVNVTSATPDYTLINSEKNVYEKNFGTGKMGVVCIISDQIFTRIVIPVDCPNYEQVRDSILEHVYQIQGSANE